MTVQITSATHWLLLDNLQHRWPYRTNMTQGQADAAMLWAVAAGHVVDGKITPSGEVALLTAPLPRNLENA